jgi:hypothetical protein
VFTIVQEDGPPGENVTFHRLPDGRVNSVFLIQSTWTRLTPM